MVGTASSPVSITDVQFSTDKPKPGDELTVKVVGNSKVDIESGAYTDVLLMLGRFEYINKSYDLCDKTQFNTTCPLKAGDQELVNTIYIPDTMPIGK
ncbi:hypothetical protein EIP86_006967 [Pleurotus ostreatoroseus]|nr:hypothetical protein EIP86_006967 [Pleurotus ostreatoroseus]